MNTFGYGLQNPLYWYDELGLLSRSETRSNQRKRNAAPLPLPQNFPPRGRNKGNNVPGTTFPLPQKFPSGGRNRGGRVAGTNEFCCDSVALEKCLRLIPDNACTAADEVAAKGGDMAARARCSGSVADLGIIAYCLAKNCGPQQCDKPCKTK